MTLTKEIVVDKIEILEDGHIQVCTVTKILEDGVIISKSNHRKVIMPGQPVEGEDSLVQAIAGLVHTPAKVKAFRDQIKREQSNPQSDI